MLQWNLATLGGLEISAIVDVNQHLQLAICGRELAIEIGHFILDEKHCIGHFILVVRQHFNGPFSGRGDIFTLDMRMQLFWPNYRRV